MTTNLMFVKYATEVLKYFGTSPHTTERTLEKNHILVKFAIRGFLTNVTLINTEEFTRVRSRTSVKFVAKNSPD